MWVPGMWIRKRVDQLAEPNVLSKTSEESDCKRALLSGPYAARGEGHSNKVSLGVVGLHHLVEMMEEWAGQCNEPVASIPHSQTRDPKAERKHRLLFPDFPGYPAVFEKTLAIEKPFKEKIPLSEIACLDKSNKYAYIEGLLGIFEARLAHMIGASDRKPDVVLVLLTDEMYDTCHIVGDYHQKLRRARPPSEAQLDLFKDFDQFSNLPPKELEKRHYRVLRSALKRIAMNPKYGVPIQIVRERTLRGEDTQNLATRSWNLCTGVYYKSGDLPWIVSGLDKDTCFLGVSFFHKKTPYMDEVYTSMAHLFSNEFDSIVLRGDKVSFDETLRAPALDRPKARRLIELALHEYRTVRQTDISPKRLVIHKTSRFNNEELLGFADVLDPLRIAYDLVSVTKSDLRLVRWGMYPVPRGTVWIASECVAFLYTKGFVLDLQTYPGSHLPSPFMIEKARGDSSMQTICKDILALTKLNWNTADFCCGVPITIGFSRNVGEILKEFDDSDSYPPNRLYRFYM
jgi:hypothetical protein